MNIEIRNKGTTARLLENNHEYNQIAMEGSVN